MSDRDTSKDKASGERDQVRPDTLSEAPGMGGGFDLMPPLRQPEPIRREHIGPTAPTDPATSLAPTPEADIAPSDDALETLRLPEPPEAVADADEHQHDSDTPIPAERRNYYVPPPPPRRRDPMVPRPVIGDGLPAVTTHLAEAGAIDPATLASRAEDIDEQPVESDSAVTEQRDGTDGVIGTPAPFVAPTAVLPETLARADANDFRLHETIDHAGRAPAPIDEMEADRSAPQVPPAEPLHDLPFDLEATIAAALDLPRDAPAPAEEQDAEALPGSEGDAFAGDDSPSPEPMPNVEPEAESEPEPQPHPDSVAAAAPVPRLRPGAAPLTDLWYGRETKRPINDPDDHDDNMTQRTRIETSAHAGMAVPPAGAATYDAGAAEESPRPPRQRGGIDLPIVVVGFVAVAALGIAAWVYADTRRAVRSVSAELAAVTETLAAAQANETAEGDDGALQELSNRLAIVEEAWRTQASQQAALPEITENEAIPAALAEEAAPTNCMPSSMRFLVSAGDSYPICGTDGVVDVLSVGELEITFQGGNAIAVGGSAVLPATDCRVAVLSANANGMAGYGEVRVNC